VDNGGRVGAVAEKHHREGGSELLRPAAFDEPLPDEKGGKANKTEDKRGDKPWRGPVAAFDTGVLEGENDEDGSCDAGRSCQFWNDAKAERELTGGKRRGSLLLSISAVGTKEDIRV
jgi:hypothetical protein